ncbi:hypothetical protein ThvES_00019220, partial [Thiovulum sp. ES]
YLIAVEKYRDACEKIDKMSKKEREKNQKFMNAQKKLKDEHEETVTSLKHDLRDVQRELNKNKSSFSEKDGELIKFKNALAEKDREILEYQNALAEKEKELEKYINPYTTLTTAQSFLTPEPEKTSLPKEEEKISEAPNAEKIIAEKYPKEKSSEILSLLINELSKTIFNFQKISISYFEENKLVFLQRAFGRKIQADLEEDSPTLVNQIVNLILKENFKHIHEVFAEKVLEASDVDRGIFKFFENHVIEDEDKTRWNTFAITRFMNEYMKHTSNVERLKHDIEKLEEKKISANESENKLSGDEEKKEELKKVVAEKKKIERLLHMCETKKTESEIELRRIEKQYLLLHEATTIFLMQTRIVK